MIAVALSELQSLGLGRLEGDAETVTGVEIDSRRIGPGDLFVALGRGVEFVDDARRQGAAATLVPDDGFAAMAALGRLVRGRSRAHVVAITGSSGKTSTKDILAALCRPVARTVAAEGGHNNEIGLPLTLTRIEDDTENVITDMDRCSTTAAALSPSPNSPTVSSESRNSERSWVRSASSGSGAIEVELPAGIRAKRANTRARRPAMSSVVGGSTVRSVRSKAPRYRAAASASEIWRYSGGSSSSLWPRRWITSSTPTGTAKASLAIAPRL